MDFKVYERDCYLVTKLGPTLYENAHAIDDTLAWLSVDYIEIMILHHPVNNYVYAYKMLEKSYRKGKLRSIELSNFPTKKFRRL